MLPMARREANWKPFFLALVTLQADAPSKQTIAHL
jgi:hypothetical protein